MYFFHGFGLRRKVFYYIHAIIHWISYIALNDWYKQYKPRTAWTGMTRLDGQSKAIQGFQKMPTLIIFKQPGARLATKRGCLYGVLRLVEVDKSWGVLQGLGRPGQGAPLLLMGLTICFV
jgi:hypothetical protein